VKMLIFTYSAAEPNVVLILYAMPCSLRVFLRQCLVPASLCPSSEAEADIGGVQLGGPGLT